MDSSGAAGRLQGRRILLGITGSIAAYKAAMLCRLLTTAGAEVRVVMTPLAKQFITPLTMATLSKNPILVEFFDPENGAWNSHISLGEWADCLLIAPATANTLAKMASGVADNLLLTTYLSARCLVIAAPAMDLDMYAHPATQENLRRLAERGVKIVEPAFGELASGLTGKGRMAEPAEIAAFVGSLFGNEADATSAPGADDGVVLGIPGTNGAMHAGSDAQAVSETGACIAAGTFGRVAAGKEAGTNGSAIPVGTVSGALSGTATRTNACGDLSCGKTDALHGLHFVVTAGATIEPIDPVRFLSNHSTGKMGYAIAGELARRGARVTLVSGRTNLQVPEGVDRVDVLSAEEMYRSAVDAFTDADGAVMCAAVADYTPARVSENKLAKGDGPLTLTLQRTRDIAAELGRRKGDRLLVGFALETDDEEAHAEQKLIRKNFDFIVLNSLRDAGAGFRTDTNKVTLIDRKGSEALPLLPKAEVAVRIADRIVRFFAGRKR